MGYSTTFKVTKVIIVVQIFLDANSSWMARVIVILIFLPNIVTNSVTTIFDVVRKDTNFHYRLFPTFPSKLATMEYCLSFNITKINNHCGGGVCTVILDIYTTGHDKNLFMNCSNDGFGQLRNENLQTPLYLRYKSYRFTTCRMDDLNSDMLHCEGKTTIQDYKPRRYGFSFGYECHIAVKPSLIGLSYNFTIYVQSNKTKCLPFPQIPGTIEQCTKFYDHISLPNMIGDPDVKSAQMSMAGLHGYYPIFSDILSQSPTGGCYKHMEEFFCRSFVPECDHVANLVIYICKETCLEFLYSCFNYLQRIFSLYVTKKFRISKKITDKNILDLVNCNYLPSVNDPIMCYYEPVTCDPPPNVANARMINRTESNGTYLAMAQVEYECLNETFRMEGNSTVTCLYSGEWYKIPQCLKRNNKSLKGSNLNPLNIVLPLLILPLLPFILAYLLLQHMCSKKKTQEYFTRLKEYDAFVCYEYNEVDEDFAENRVRMELEENCDPPFKLCLHRRDFKAAWDIMWNIRNAIQNSNSAIIVMSQDYVNSFYCKEEFEQCYREHMKDPAFKLFVILMQPIEQLNGTSAYMKSFFTSKVCLERNDPKLFKKILDHLIQVKKPKGNKKFSRKQDPEEQEINLM